MWDPTLLGVEKLITEIVVYFLQIPYGIGGLIYGGAIQFMAVTGMHHTIVPITIAMVTDTGFDLINPLGTAAIAGQFGAAIAVMTMQSNKVKKSAMFGAALPALFGITEPAMFAVTLPRVKTLLIWLCWWCIWWMYWRDCRDRLRGNGRDHVTRHAALSGWWIGYVHRCYAFCCDARFLYDKTAL